MAHTSSEAVADLGAAVRVWASAAEDITRQGTAAVRRIVADAESEVQQRGRRVRSLEAALAGARGEQRAALARELHAATATLDAGKRALRQAKDAESRMHVLQRRISDAIETRVPRAAADLKRRLEALERYKTSSTPRGDSVAVSDGGHAKELSFMQNLGLAAGAVASLLPGGAGIPAHDANLQQPGDTAVSRPVNADETKGSEGILYRLVEHQSDQGHHLEHSYEEQELKDAEKRNRPRRP